MMLTKLTTGLAIAVISVLATATQTGDIIKKYDFENDGLGNYSLHVETGSEKGALTSFIHKQQGHLENKDSDNESLRVEGQILYKVDDSLSIAVSYTADERGYRPKTRWVFSPKKTQQAANGTILDLRGPDEKSGISGTVLGTLVGGNGK